MQGVALNQTNSIHKAQIWNKTYCFAANLTKGWSSKHPDTNLFSHKDSDQNVQVNNETMITFWDTVNNEAENSQLRVAHLKCKVRTSTLNKVWSGVTVKDHISMCQIVPSISRIQRISGATVSIDVLCFSIQLPRMHSVNFPWCTLPSAYLSFHCVVANYLQKDVQRQIPWSIGF